VTPNSTGAEQLLIIIVAVVVVVSYILWLEGIESAACTGKDTPEIYQTMLFSSSSQYDTKNLPACKSLHKMNNTHQY